MDILNFKSETFNVYQSVRQPYTEWSVSRIASGFPLAEAKTKFYFKTSLNKKTRDQ